MKRKIMIFVTILFVALALSGFAHNRHNRHESKCPCEQTQVRHKMNKENFDGRKPDFRPFKNGKQNRYRKGRNERINSSTSIKGFYNGKIAMVNVGPLLTPEETVNLQLLN